MNLRCIVEAAKARPDDVRADLPSIEPLELASDTGRKPGWTGRYFANAERPDMPAVTRVDRPIWLTLSTRPPLPEFPRVASVGWTATLRVRTCGTYPR